MIQPNNKVYPEILADIKKIIKASGKKMCTAILY